MYTITTTYGDIDEFTTRITRDGIGVSKLNLLNKQGNTFYGYSNWVGVSQPEGINFALNIVAYTLAYLPQSIIVPKIQTSGVKPTADAEYFHDKVVAKSDNYKKQCIEGRIAYNPYTVYSGYVRAGSVVKDVDTAFVQNYPIFRDAYVLGSRLNEGLYANVRANIEFGVWIMKSGDTSGYYIDDYTSPTVRVVRKTQTLSVSPLQAGLRDKFERDCASSLSAIDDNIVIDTIAKANGKELDLLTTIAEGPKTIQSIIDGFRLIAKITLDAKRKEFEITDSYEKFKRKTKNLEISKNNDYKRSKRRKKAPSKSSIRERQRLQNQSAFGSETAVELTDAITGVWMNYRYNIRPIVYTIQDTVSAIQKFNRKFLTARSVLTIDYNPPEIEGYTFEGSSKITHRCWIKRRYDVSDDWAKFSKVISVDIFVTAYELIPVWSIVADWFFNFGTLLRATQFRTYHTQQAATYSTKIEVKGKYVLDSDPTQYNEVEFIGYKRQLITPSQHMAVKYVNKFDDFKGFDALSFLWHSIRRPVKQIPYGKI